MDLAHTKRHDLPGGGSTMATNTETKWFVEQRTILGRWMPVIYHGEKPVAKTMAGTRSAFRRDPVEVPTCYHNLTLNQLAEIYGVDGRFKSQA
jgi:hypothetical protein